MDPWGTPDVTVSQSEDSPYTTTPVRNEQRCCSGAEWLQEARYKRAAKALATAVANFGCSGKPFDSDKQRCCSSAENSRITICTAKWLQSGLEKTKIHVQ